ncbi:MAG: DUF3892 domain-containing protein [Parcubacteria group bacterium]|nr:DUF3892 domain-containing protein [Parcubacteria group bacterium]
MSVRITCINKDNGDHYDPHEAITHLGWLDESSKKNDKCTRLEMVKFIEDGNQAYVKDGLGIKAFLVVRTSRYGNKYVQTEADGRPTNNLLALSECV